MALDDKAVQSILYGPTLMVVRDGTPSYREFSFYKHLKLDGDLAAAIAPTNVPMQFTTHGYTLAPYYISDPVPGEFNTYHPYVKRVEPEVVFGSINTGVPNDSVRDADGQTFLDRIWEAAPFANHGQFVRRVEEVSSEWLAAGRHTQQQRQAIRVGAARAQQELGSSGSCSRFDGLTSVLVPLQPRTVRLVHRRGERTVVAVGAIPAASDTARYRTEPAEELPEAAPPLVSARRHRSSNSVVKLVPSSAVAMTA
jgi:hypothetical protein